MATSDVKIDEGTGVQLATYSITEDAGTKEIGRAVLNKSDGTELGTASAPLRIDPTGTTPQPVTGTFYQATQPVSASSLPLPTGASTESTLASIKAKTDNIPALGQAVAGSSVPVVLPSAQISTLTPQTNALTDAQLRATAVPVSGTFYQATQPVSASSLPLPTGASTLAEQQTQTAEIGAMNESAASTDTSTSGINGLIKRLLQRITTLIGLFQDKSASQVNGYNSSAITDTTSTSILSAQGAGVVFYMTDLTVSNKSSSVSTVVRITDGNGGNVKHQVVCATGGGGESKSFLKPVPFTANTAIHAVCVTTGAEVYVSVNGYIV